MPKLTSKLLERANRIAALHAIVSAEITAAFNERYGATHSYVDCDFLIDALDYGVVAAPTLAECDAAMESCGAPRRRRGKSVDAG